MVGALPQLIDADHKRIHLFHEMRHAREGWLRPATKSSPCTSTWQSRRSAPFPPDVQRRVDAPGDAHVAPAREALGRIIGLAQGARQIATPAATGLTHWVGPGCGNRRPVPRRLAKLHGRASHQGCGSVPPVLPRLSRKRACAAVSAPCGIVHQPHRRAVIGLKRREHGPGIDIAGWPRRARPQFRPPPPE